MLHLPSVFLMSANLSDQSRLFQHKEHLLSQILFLAYLLKEICIQKHLQNIKVILKILYSGLNMYGEISRKKLSSGQLKLLLGHLQGTENTFKFPNL